MQNQVPGAYFISAFINMPATGEIHLQKQRLVLYHIISLQGAFLPAIYKIRAAIPLHFGH